MPISLFIVCWATYTANMDDSVLRTHPEQISDLGADLNIAVIADEVVRQLVHGFLPQNFREVLLDNLGWHVRRTWREPKKDGTISAEYKVTRALLPIVGSESVPRFTVITRLGHFSCLRELAQDHTINFLAAVLANQP